MAPYQPAAPACWPPRRTQCGEGPTRGRVGVGVPSRTREPGRGSCTGGGREAAVSVQMYHVIALERRSGLKGT